MKQRGLPELSVLIETKYFIDGCLLLSVKVDSNGLLSYIMIVYTCANLQIKKCPMLNMRI